jgi:pantothenate kinase
MTPSWWGMDGFHLANSELARLGRGDRKGVPETFDVDGYVALLNRLCRSGDAPIHAPVFNRGIEEPIGSAVSVPADVPLVITEGNYLLLDDHGWGAVRDCLDEAWFLAVDSAVRGASAGSGPPAVRPLGGSGPQLGRLGG